MIRVVVSLAPATSAERARAQTALQNVIFAQRLPVVHIYLFALIAPRNHAIFAQIVAKYAMLESVRTR